MLAAALLEMPPEGMRVNQRGREAGPGMTLTFFAGVALVFPPRTLVLY